MEIKGGADAPDIGGRRSSGVGASEHAPEKAAPRAASHREGHPGIDGDLARATIASAPPGAGLAVILSRRHPNPSSS